MTRRVVVLVPILLSSLFLTGCWMPTGSTGRDPSALREAIPQSIFDGAHNSGNISFFFLPPLADDPVEATGSFDPTLSPTVEIRPAAGGAPVAVFVSSTGSESGTVRVVPADELYIVNWDTSRFDLTAGAQYRISVLLNEVSLGFADVVVVGGGNELKNAATGELIALRDGRTLPIKFRIETGALTTIGAAGGVAIAMDGLVRIEILPGALAEDTDIIASPLFSYPESTLIRVVPQTVYEFGPDGITFVAPARASISYDPALIPEGLPEIALSLVKLSGEDWIAVPNCVVDGYAHTVTGSLFGFSTYAVAAVPSLSGVIRSSTGTPVNGALVRLYNDDGFSAYTGSGPMGLYAYYSVPPGSYYLVAKRDGFVVNTQVVNLEAFSIIGTWDLARSLPSSGDGPHRVVFSDETHLSTYYSIFGGPYSLGGHGVYALYDVISTMSDSWYRYTLSYLEGDSTSITSYCFIADFNNDAQGTRMSVRWIWDDGPPTESDDFPPGFDISADTYSFAEYYLVPNP